MRHHQLKTWPQYFEAVWSGEKRFEVRKDDRRFEVGDILDLHEWNPPGPTACQLDEGYTGRAITAQVTYVLRGPALGGLAAGHAVLSLLVFARTTNASPPAAVTTPSGPGGEATSDA